MAIDANPPQRHVAYFPDASQVATQGLPGNSCCDRVVYLQVTTARIDTDVTQLKNDVNELKIGVKELKVDVTQLKVDVKELKVDVTQLKIDVTQLKIDVAVVKERLLHMPTKAQLLIWGLGAAAVIIAAQWRIVAALLEAQNAALAAQLARAISS